MSILKQVIASALHKVAHVSKLSLYLAKHKHCNRILMFHGVGGADYPVRIFEHQIKYLMNNFKIISIDELISSDNVLNCISLTFDDGLKNNYNVVYPLLSKYNLPATFYVCPELIDTGKWLWTHDIRQRLLTLDAKVRNEIFNDNVSVENFILELKKMNVTERNAYHDKVIELSNNFSPNNDELIRYQMMSWHDILDLDMGLITIGSHTLSHVELGNVDDFTMKNEILGSKNILESKLSRRVDHFCYPSGIYNDASLAMVRSVYRSAVTTRRGFVDSYHDKHLLNRLPTAETTALLSWRLHRITS